MAFLEERFPIEIDYGSSFGESYAVQVVSTSNGNEYFSTRHPYPTFQYEIGLQNRNDAWLINHILDLFHRSGGVSGGFRLKNHADFSTNGYRGVPTFADQVAVLVSAGIYQITRWYGLYTDPKAARRRVRKPVANTVLAGIRNPITGDNQITAFTVDNTTGLITLSANKTKTITAITQAAAAMLTVGASHGFVVGDSVYVSGVVGMTQINGRRAVVTATGATTITVAINSTAFTAYGSAGTVNTNPQTGELVTAGCYFDLPVRFLDDLGGMTFSSYQLMGSAVTVREILNP